MLMLKQERCNVAPPRTAERPARPPGARPLPGLAGDHLSSAHATCCKAWPQVLRCPGGLGTLPLSGLVLRTARNWGLSSALVPPRTEPGTPSTYPGPEGPQGAGWRKDKQWERLAGRRHPRHSSMTRSLENQGWALSPPAPPAAAPWPTHLSPWRTSCLFRPSKDTHTVFLASGDSMI